MGGVVRKEWTNQEMGRVAGYWSIMMIIPLSWIPLQFTHTLSLTISFGLKTLDRQEMTFVRAIPFPISVKGPSAVGPGHTCLAFWPPSLFLGYLTEGSHHNPPLRTGLAVLPLCCYLFVSSDFILENSHCKP